MKGSEVRILSGPHMVSAVVLAHNEEKSLAQCLLSLAWCDDIVVIDDYSTDQTVEIAEKHGARVFKRELNNDFSAQRNFGLEKAQGEWVLFIDADERSTEAVASELKTQMSNVKTTLAGFYIKRRDVIWGRELKHGETGNIKLLRLAKKGAGKWRRAVHEVWDVEGEVGELKNNLMHYPHQTLREFITDIDRYSTLHAQELEKEGKRSNILKIWIWPKLKFIQNWIFRLGFLDGTAGFVVAILMSFHSYLAWSKLWLNQKMTNAK